MYAERAYFDGDHCHHCAAYHDHLRRKRIAQVAVDILRGRR